MRFPFLGKPALPPFRDVMDEAVRLCRSGRSVDAETLLRRRLDTIEKQFGTANALYSETQNGYAALLGLLGKREQARISHAAACAFEPPADDPEARKSWMSHLVDYGEALSSADLLDDAERIHRRSVENRLAFYGRDHAGYAFGLEPLAMLLLRRAKVEEAVALQEEAVNNFWRNGHPRFLNAVLFLSAARQAAGNTGDLFTRVADIPPDAVEELTRSAGGLLAAFPNPVRQPVLLEVAALAARTLGEDHRALLNLLSEIANNESERGKDADHTVRMKAARLVFESQERQSQYPDAWQTLMGLAFAQGDAGEYAAAAQSYDRVVAESTAKGEFTLASKAERNHGLMLSENDRREAAEPHLRNAVELAQRTGSNELIGSAECALGIFLQHGGLHDEAQPILESALRHLPSTHRDAIYARSHHTALIKGASCGCNDMEGAFDASYCEAIREQVEREMPGLLKSIDFERRGDDPPSLQVHLLRAPSEGELDRLNTVVTQAEAAFKKAVTERR